MAKKIQAKKTSNSTMVTFNSLTLTLPTTKNIKTVRHIQITVICCY